LIIIGGILIFLDELIVRNQIDELDLDLSLKVFWRFKQIYALEGIIGFSIDADD
jgi:hypothetical protein